MSSQPDFKLSADSAALVAELRKAVVGTTVSYETLSQAIGRNVQNSASSALQSARHVVQREFRMVFSTIRGSGLKRLNDSDIVDLSDKAREHARRHAKRTARKLVCVDYDALPKAKQTKHNAALSMFGVLAEIATDKAQGRLEKRISDVGQQLPGAKAAMEALGCIS